MPGPSVTTSVQFPLDRNERQLWVGVPRQGIALRSSDWFVIPFSLAWVGFAIFMEVKLILSGASMVMRIFDAPFIALGLYILLGRFWVDTRARAGTAYAVTSDRVIIQSGGSSPTTQSLSLRTLSDVTLQESPDGTGTITFGPVPSVRSMYLGAGASEIGQHPALEMIPNARQVYEIIREAQRTALAIAPAKG